jgi:hypothetical protein
VLTNRSGRMIEDQYPLGFKVSLHRKDLGIALEMAGDAELMLPGAMLVAALEDRLLAEDHGGEDMSALARVIREIAAPSGPVAPPQPVESPASATPLGPADSLEPPR